VKRVVVAILAALVALDVALAVGVIGPAANADAPTVAVSAVVTTTTTTTTAPTTTTTAAPVDVPVAPPKHPYAPEPVVTIGQLVIPKLGLDWPLGEGISLNNIDRGPSHWPGSALPGRIGNMVIAGHRVTHTHPFLHIDSLVPGDEVFVDYQGQRYRYVVTGSEVVTPKQVSIVNQTSDATGTLFACHPPHSARYRYVVHLKLT
jgi:sortase A